MKYPIQEFDVFQLLGIIFEQIAENIKTYLHSACRQVSTLKTETIYIHENVNIFHEM